MLEELINFKLAVRKKLPKSEVRERYTKYTNTYDELAGKQTIRDKLEFRDMFNTYIGYMSRTEDKEIIF